MTGQSLKVLVVQPNEKEPASIILDNRSDPCQGTPQELLVVQPNMSDGDMNRSLGLFQDGLEDWKYSVVSRKLRLWSGLLWDRFVPKLWKGLPTSKPEFVFMFEGIHRGWLGHYHYDRNGFGNRFEIGINPRYFKEHSEVQIAAILLHEMFHAVEDMTGTAPRSRNNYHSAAFRKALDKIGIPCNRWGAATAKDLVIAPSPFLEWAKKHNLDGSKGCFSKPEPEPRKRPSSRKCWHCRCGIKVYVSRGIVFDATCNVCNSKFVDVGLRSAAPPHPRKEKEQ